MSYILLAMQTNRQDRFAQMYLSCNETIVHLLSKHLDEISFVECQFKLWMLTGRALNRIIVIESNEQPVRFRLWTGGRADNLNTVTMIMSINHKKFLVLINTYTQISNVQMV